MSEKVKSGAVPTYLHACWLFPGKGKDRRKASWIGGMSSGHVKFEI